MSAMASQITSVSIVCSDFCSGANQRKHQSSAWLAFVMGNSPHKGSVTRKMFLFDVIMQRTSTYLSVLFDTLIGILWTARIRPTRNTLVSDVTSRLRRTPHTVYHKAWRCPHLRPSGGSRGRPGCSSDWLRYPSERRRNQCTMVNRKQGPGVGVTKAPFVNFSNSKIFDLTKSTS